MLTTGKTTPEVPRGTTTRRRSRAKVVTTPPKRQLGGLDVSDIRPIEALPGRPLRIAIVTLADETTTHACLDCPDPLDFTGTRGDVMAHRNQVHGTRYGKKRPKIIAPPEEGLPEILDAVLAPREPAPATAYDMTLGEVLALAPTLKALGDLIERVETERAADAEELKLLRAYERTTKVKLDNYDNAQDELVGLRVQLRSMANYVAVKEEMYRLKAWKRNMIKKLKGMGFQLTEEEEQ